MRNKTEIRSLTGLRFLAAFFVFINHVHQQIQIPGWAAKPIYAQGVSIFFVLSGFVLALTYDQKSDWGRYAVARFARIYPTFLLAALFAHMFSPRSLPLCEAVLLQTWVPCDPVNSLDWTISAEAFFYAVFPFIMAFRLEVVGFLASLVFAAAAMFLVKDDAGAWLTHLPIARLPEFLAGILIYKASRRFKFEIGFTAASIIEVGCIIALYFASSASRSFYNHAGASRVLGEYVAAVGIFPAACLLVFFLAQNRGVLSRLLSTKPMNALGHASYAFYLFHLIIIENVRHQPWLSFVLSVALALMVYATFETRAKTAINGLFRLVFDRSREQTP